MAERRRVRQLALAHAASLAVGVVFAALHSAGALGEFATYTPLSAKRWVARPPSVEEALLVAQKGIAAAIAELFPQPPE